VCDENLGVIEIGEHDWDVFELVDMESGADFDEVVFGSIVHDGSWGQVLEEDIIIDRHFWRSSGARQIGDRGGW
jgi:hypothetical protein